MTEKTLVSLIAAVSRNGAIGRDNQLPWNIPEDLKHFRATTMGAPVIMGRKTFHSIGRLLPGRKNIIITRQTSLEVPGAVLAHSLESALKIAEEPSADGKKPAQIFVIGGGEIYTQAMPFADRLYITEVDRSVDGDAWFPEWPKLKTESLRLGDRIVKFRQSSCDERPDGTPSFRFYQFDRV